MDGWTRGGGGGSSLPNKGVGDLACSSGDEDSQWPVRDGSIRLEVTGGGGRKVTREVADPVHFGGVGFFLRRRRRRKGEGVEVELILFPRSRDIRKRGNFTLLPACFLPPRLPARLLLLFLLLLLLLLSCLLLLLFLTLFFFFFLVFFFSFCDGISGAAAVPSMRGRRCGHGVWVPAPSVAAG